MLRPAPGGKGQCHDQTCVGGIFQNWIFQVPHRIELEARWRIAFIMMGAKLAILISRVKAKGQTDTVPK